MGLLTCTKFQGTGKINASRKKLNAIDCGVYIPFHMFVTFAGNKI